MNTARVFVVQKQMKWNSSIGELEPRFDLSSAVMFGELVYLLSPSAAPFNGEPIVRELKQKLSDFSDKDYLLLIGNPCLIGWATAIAAASNDGMVNLLQWSGKEQAYIEVNSPCLLGA